MARRLYSRANPEVFGEDVGNLAYEALGIGLAAMVNDRVTMPLVKKLVPSLGGTIGQLADAGTTALTGWAIGEGVGAINKNAGRKMKRGALVLSMGKGFAAFLPGYSMSASFPLPSNFSLFQQVPSNGNGKKQIAQKVPVPALTGDMGL